MKTYVRQDGSEIELNDAPANQAKAAELGWVVKQKAAGEQYAERKKSNDSRDDLPPINKGAVKAVIGAILNSQEKDPSEVVSEISMDEAEKMESLMFSNPKKRKRRTKEEMERDAQKGQD